MREWSLCLGCGSYFLSRHLHPFHSARNNSCYVLEDVRERKAPEKRKKRWDVLCCDAHHLEHPAVCSVTPRFQECSCAQWQRCHVLQQDGQNHLILHQAAGLQCLDKKVSDTLLNIIIRRKHFSFWRSRNTKTPPRISDSGSMLANGSVIKVAQLKTHKSGLMNE